MFDESNIRKCFTVFIHLQQKWRNFKINLKSIDLFVRNAILHIENNAYHLAIHSPNSLPNFYINEFIKIEHGTINTISYSEVQTKLLGSDFDTNCFDYDLDHKFANYNMRSD